MSSGSHTSAARSATPGGMSGHGSPTRSATLAAHAASWSRSASPSGRVVRSR